MFLVFKYEEIVYSIYNTSSCRNNWIQTSKERKGKRSKQAPRSDFCMARTHVRVGCFDEVAGGEIKEEPNNVDKFIYNFTTTLQIQYVMLLILVFLFCFPLKSFHLSCSTEKSTLFGIFFYFRTNENQY